MLTDFAPSATLYLNRLDERIHVDSLRVLLFELCSQFGFVLDVVASGTLRKKGQAFVVFNDVASATIALKHLRHQTFLGKPISASFAQSTSDATLKFEGTYKPKPFAKRKITTGAPMSLELPAT